MEIFSFGGFAIIFMILAIALIFFGVKTVPQGEEHTVERFGKYTQTLPPGLHLIVPFVDIVAHRMNMMEQVMDVASQDIITKDNAMVRVDGVVFYQIINSAKAAYEVSDLNLAIMSLTQTHIRTVMGSMQLDELLSQRDQINADLLEAVDEATAPWGIKVTRIQIKDITPPDNLVNAMAQQMKAEREKRAAVLEAEGIKTAQIERALGNKEAAILEAEGVKQAEFLAAEARERMAEADARATHMLSRAVNQGNVHALNYFIAEKYIEALNSLASADNQKVIMMPLEASSMIGSIGGIAEIAKEALQPKSNPPASSSANPSISKDFTPPRPETEG